MEKIHSFSSYMNGLFLNFYSETPHPIIKNFLPYFVPLVLDKPKRSDGLWMGYLNEEFEPPVVVSHSLFFQNHPFIDAKTVQCEFKIYTDYNENLANKVSDIKNTQILLDFDGLKDGLDVFARIKNELSTTTEQLDFFEDDVLKTCDLYVPEILYDIPCRVRLRLLKRRGLNGFYQLSISNN